MRIGTTPSYTFDIPFDLSIIENIRVVFKQDDKIVLKKEKADCTFDVDTSSIKITLSEKETFEFEKGQIIKIQLHVSIVGNSAITSNVMDDYAWECLDDEVIT